MNVKNIELNDIVIQANDGLDMTEATGFKLKNVQLVTNNTQPVMNIHNSSDISLNNIRYSNNAELLLNVSGEKSKGIKISATDVKKAKKSVELNYGATEGAVKII